MKLFVILLLALYCAFVTGFESNDDKKVTNFLAKFFDYDKNSDKLSDEVKKLQEMAGLDANGKITKELVAHVAKARCGGKDKDKKSKRYNVANSKWDKGVTYRLYIHKERNPPTMKRQEIERAIVVGMNYWSTVADIYFGQSSETRGSLFSLSFADGEHVMYSVQDGFKESRDPYPLDNVAGGVLAHAFFPKNGNLHFDTAEKWTEGTDDGINLRIVTAHEGGHAIGLFHSNDPKALMAPWYGGYISEREYKLPSDDSQGAIQLYGNRRGKRAFVRDTESNVTSKNKEALCNIENIKAAFEFTDKMVYVVSSDNIVFRLNGITVDDSFEGKPFTGRIRDFDAAVHDRSGKRLIVFIGDKVLSATGSDLASLTFNELNITQAGAFEGKVSAVFPRDKTNKHSAQQFWAVQDGELLSMRVRGDKVRFGRRTRKMDEILEMSDGGIQPPSIDGAFTRGKRDKLKLVLFVGNSVYVGKPKGSKHRKFLIPAQYPKTFKSILNCPVQH